MEIVRLRNSVRAIITQEGRLLTVTMRNPRTGERYHLLPGGGQEPEELFPQTLERECLEELGARVEVGELVLIRDYLGWQYDFGHDDLHQVEFFFRCRLLSPVCLEQAAELDREQTGVEWVPLAKLREVRLYPAALKECVTPAGDIRPPSVYLGAVN